MYLDDVDIAVFEPLIPAFNPNITTAASIKSSFLGGTYCSSVANTFIIDGTVANAEISPDTLDVPNNQSPNAVPFSNTFPALSLIVVANPNLLIIGPATLPATIPPTATPAPKAKSLP